MTPHRLTRSAALGLTVVALAAPAAAAAIPHDAAPQATTGGSPQDLRSPDNRAVEAARAQERYYGSYGSSAGEPAQDLRSPDARDAAAGRGTFNAPDVAVVKLPQPVPVADDGIDGGDVGIGAGTLLGVIALGLGGAVTIMHRRRRGPRTATA